MKSVMQLITLALALLLAIPAFAMPMAGDAGRGGAFGQLDLTEEEMANMTVGELKEMMAEEAKTNAPNGTPFMGEIGLLVTDLTVEDVEGMTPAEIEEMKVGLAEELDGMTLSEIEDLKEERRAEMENMTLAELNDQREVMSLLGLGGGHHNGPDNGPGNGQRMAGQGGFEGQGQGPQGNGPEMNGGGRGEQQCMGGMGMGCMNGMNALAPTAPGEEDAEL